MGRKIRYPRLSTPPRDLRRIESILWATYNKMMKDRSFSKKTFGYDIYKTKRGVNAKRCFIFLADTLSKEHIDPSLYLKVLSKYGQFGQKQFLPPIEWLAKPKTLTTFGWLADAERAKFVKNSDWEAYLDDPGMENSRHIGKAVSESRKMVEEVMDTFGLKIGEAALLLADKLSPWFLAICPSFLRDEGERLLGDKEYDLFVKCLRHLIKDRNSFREALDEYGKF